MRNPIFENLRKSRLVIISLIVILLAIPLGVFWDNLATLFSDSRSELTVESDGGNKYYYQRKKPTKEERENGIRAFKRFPKAWTIEKSRLADDMVLGRTLIGWKRSEVEASLGKLQPPGLAPCWHYDVLFWVARTIFVSSLKMV